MLTGNHRGGGDENIGNGAAGGGGGGRYSLKGGGGGDGGLGVLTAMLPRPSQFPARLLNFHRQTVTRPLDEVSFVLFTFVRCCRVSGNPSLP